MGVKRVFPLSEDDDNLAYTRWNCKYHIVLHPNIEKSYYGVLRKGTAHILEGYVS